MPRRKNKSSSGQFKSRSDKQQSKNENVTEESAGSSTGSYVDYDEWIRDIEKKLRTVKDILAKRDNDINSAREATRENEGTENNSTGTKDQVPPEVEEITDDKLIDFICDLLENELARSDGGENQEQVQPTESSVHQDKSSNTSNKASQQDSLRMRVTFRFRDESPEKSTESSDQDKSSSTPNKVSGQDTNNLDKNSSSSNESLYYDAEPFFPDLKLQSKSDVGKGSIQLSEKLHRSYGLVNEKAGAYPKTVSSIKPGAYPKTVSSIKPVDVSKLSTVHFKVHSKPPALSLWTKWYRYFFPGDKGNVAKDSGVTSEIFHYGY